MLDQPTDQPIQLLHMRMCVTAMCKAKKARKGKYTQVLSLLAMDLDPLFLCIKSSKKQQQKTNNKKKNHKKTILSIKIPPYLV